MPFRFGFIAIFIISSSALGQTWTAIASGNWSVGTNWDTGLPPNSTASTSLIFNADPGISYTATNDLSLFFLNAMTLNNHGSGTVEIANAAGSSLAFSGTNPTISLRGPGPTLISGGTLFFNSATTIREQAGIDAPSRLTITSALAGASDLIISRGQGRYLSETVLNPTSNTHSGNIEVRFGTLTLSSASALGTSTLFMNVDGFGLNARGDLRVTAPTAISTPMTLQSTGGLNVLTGADLTINTNLTGNGGIGLGDGLNPSTTDLNLSGGNSYIGFTRVLGGTLNVTGTISTSNLFVGRFGTANFGSTTTFSNNRINPSVNLDGGVLNLIGNATAGNNWNEAVSTLQVRGFSTIGIDSQPATSTQLNINNVTRSGRGSLRVRGDALGSLPFGTAGSATIAVGNVAGSPIANALVGGGGAAGTTNISVLPFAVGSTTLIGLGDHFVTVGANGLRPLNLATEYASQLPIATYLQPPTTNYRLTTNMTSIAQPTTINALALAGGSAHNAATMSVTSGALISTGSHHTGPLAFGAAEGHATTSNGTLVLGTIAGTNGLTIAGTGEAAVTNTLGLSGQLTVNGGLLTIAGGGVLSNTLTPVLSGGGLSVRGFDESLTLPISVSDAGGVIQMRPLGASSNGNTTNLTLSGAITGNGILEFSGGGGSVTLDAVNNSFTGAWNVRSGTLAISAANNLGDAPVVLNGGAFAATQSIAIPNQFVLNADSTLLSQTGGDIVLTHGIDGRMAGAGLTLFGAPYVLEGPANYTGPTSLGVGGDSPGHGGIILRGDRGRLYGTSGVTMHEGSRLHIDNTGRDIGDFSPRFTKFPLTMSGGRLEMLGGIEGSGSTETLGGLTLTANTGNEINLQFRGLFAPSPTFNFDSLTRQAGSSLVIDVTREGLEFQGQLGDEALGTGVVRFATPPTLVNGILPGVFANFGDATGLAGHDTRLAVTRSSVNGGVFVRELRSGDPGVVFNTFAGSNAASNVYLDPGTFTTGNRTINSLSLQGADLRINQGETLTVTSGMIAYHNVAADILPETSSLGTAGRVASPAGVDLTIGRPSQPETGQPLSAIVALDADLLPGSGTVNFAGTGRISLKRDLSAVQRLNVHGGEVVFDTTTSNGAVSPNLHLHVRSRGNFVIVNQNIAIDQLSGDGVVNLQPNRRLDVGAANGSSTFTGLILAQTGASVHKVGTGTWRLAGAINSPQGDIVVDGGTLAFGSATLDVPAVSRSLNGTISLNAGTRLMVDSIRNFEKSIFVLGSATLDSGLTGTATTFTEPVVLFTGATLSVTAPVLGGFNFSGGFSGPGALSIDSGATLLSGVAINTGGVTIQSTQQTLIGVTNAFNGQPLTLAGNSVLLPFGGNRTVNSTTTLTGNVTFGPSANSQAFSTGFGFNFNAGVNLAGTGNRTVTVTGTGNFQFSNVTGSAANGLTKAGGGLLTLNGVNSFSGPLEINAGTLHVAGSKTGTGLVTVGTATAGAPMAVLSGLGPVAGGVTVRTTGVISPGASAGLLTITGGLLTFDAGSTYKWELAANSEVGPGTNYDRIDPGFNSTTIAAGARLVPSFIGTATMPDGFTPFWQSVRTWAVIDSSSLTTGTPFSIDNAAWASAGAFEARFGASGGLIVRWEPVPEPASILFGCAAAGVIWRVVRRRR